jgi:MFS family permease
LADSVDARRRGLAFGFHKAMDHVGAIAGALLSAWLFNLFAGNYPTIFWAAAIPGLGSLLILIFAVRDERHGHTGVGRHGDFAGTSPRLPVAVSPRLSLSLFDNNFKRYLAVLLLFTLGNSSDAFLLLRARQNGVSVGVIPLLWAALHVCKMVSSVIGGGLSDRFGRKRLIVSGWLVYAAIYFGFAFATTRLETWGLFLTYGVYFGLTEGVEKALVADLVRPAFRGTAFGLYNLIIGIGALPASLITGWLWDRFGAAPALTVGAGLSLLASALLVIAVREHNHSNEWKETDETQ